MCVYVYVCMRAVLALYVSCICARVCFSQLCVHACAFMLMKKQCIAPLARREAHVRVHFVRSDRVEIGPRPMQCGVVWCRWDVAVVVCYGVVSVVCYRGCGVMWRGHGGRGLEDRIYHIDTRPVL